MPPGDDGSYPLIDAAASERRREWTRQSCCARRSSLGRRRSGLRAPVSARGPVSWSLPMKTRLLGRTGISVSELCFGTMSFGGDADEATSAAMYKACRDAGINFFDCANEYNKGRA